MKRYTYFPLVSGLPTLVRRRLIYRHSVSFKALRGLQHGEFSVYNRPMPNENPLAGIVPKVVHPRIDGEAAITEYIEKIEGEVALDSYVKAQTSAPEVVKRINELENCLQRLANAALALSDIASVRNCAPSPRKQNCSSRIASRSMTPSIDSTASWE